MKSLKFSVIIPVKEINPFINLYVPKILNMDYKDYEIIILPNFLPDKIDKNLLNKKIKIFPTGKVSPAIKRDIGAKYASGDYIAFIDDDAYPEKNWLRLAEEGLKDKKTDAICGPAITPPESSIIQKASGLFFETIFGGGGMSYRYIPAKKSFYVNDFPSVNLIVNKKSFLKTGGFQSKFWPGEDTKFCLDFIKRGYKIWYSNKLIVYHQRRNNLFAHLKQIGGYGKHRGFFAKKFPETSLKLVYFAPSIFLIGNTGLAILSFFNSIFGKIWAVLLLIYLLLISGDILIKNASILTKIVTIPLTFFSHLTYGFEFLRGFFAKEVISKLR